MRLLIVYGYIFYKQRSPGPAGPIPSIYPSITLTPLATLPAHQRSQITIQYDSRSTMAHSLASAVVNQVARPTAIVLSSTTAVLSGPRHFSGKTLARGELRHFWTRTMYFDICMLYIHVSTEALLTVSGEQDCRDRCLYKVDFDCR